MESGSPITGAAIAKLYSVSQSVSYFTVPPRAHPSTGVFITQTPAPALDPKGRGGIISGFTHTSLLKKYISLKAMLKAQRRGDAKLLTMPANLPANLNL